MPHLNLLKRKQEERGFILFPKQLFHLGNAHVRAHIVPDITAELSLQEPAVPWHSDNNNPVNSSRPLAGMESGKEGRKELDEF